MLKEEKTMQFTEEKVERNDIFSGRVLKLHVDKVRLHDGKLAEREVCDHPGGVGVLAIDGEKNAILVRQFRYPYGEELLEIPAGKLEKGEDPLECGIRELREETGCKAENITPLGMIYPSPGYVNEKLYLYLATGLSYGECDPDEDEFLRVEKIPFDELKEMVMRDEIHDAKTVSAVLKAANMID